MKKKFVINVLILLCFFSWFNAKGQECQIQVDNSNQRFRIFFNDKRSIYLNFAMHLETDLRGYLLDTLFPEIVRIELKSTDIENLHKYFQSLLEEQSDLLAIIKEDYRHYETLVLTEQITYLFVEANPEVIVERQKWLKKQRSTLESQLQKVGLSIEIVQDILLLSFGKDYFFQYQHPDHEIQLIGLESEELIQKQNEYLNAYQNLSSFLNSKQVLLGKKNELLNWLYTLNGYLSSLYYGEYSAFQDSVRSAQSFLEELKKSKSFKNESQTLYRNFMVKTLETLISFVEVRRERDEYMVNSMLRQPEGPAIAAIGINHSTGIQYFLEKSCE
ncbi:MAG: hypothetical protein KDD48_06075 [Bdellovibrionales bacterium]|nr:hypothetical protein [Bdellovibrionales bacterium]